MFSSDKVVFILVYLLLPGAKIQINSEFANIIEVFVLPIVDNRPGKTKSSFSVVEKLLFDE